MEMRDDEYFEILTNFKGASHYSSVLKCTISMKNNFSINLVSINMLKEIFLSL